MTGNFQIIGDFISVIDNRNTDGSIIKLMGISIDKCYIPSVANVIGTDLNNYKVIRKGQFACSLMQVSRDQRIPIAMYKEDAPAIMSPAYVMFEVSRPDELLPEYMELWFKRAEFDREASFYAVGGVRGSLDWEDFCKMELPVPSLPEQQKIVRDYQVITDRIALLQKLNDNLEDYAKTVYKAFFETFEVFNGDCPDGISIIKISELPIEVTDFVANGSFADLNENVTLYDEEEYAYYVRNTDLKSNSYVKYVDEASYRFLSKSFLLGGEVIISNVADVGSVFLCPCLKKPMTLGSNVIMLKSHDNCWSYFMYLYFKFFKGKRQIVEITTGSAQPKFNKTAFRGLEGLFPDKRILGEFNEIVKPLYDQIDRYSAEIRMLRSLSKTFLGSISFKGV